MSNPTPTGSAQLAQALLLEQVGYYRKKLLNIEQEKNHQQQILQQTIDQLYQNAKQLQLKDVIQVELLHEVVKKYSFELNLGAEILEFIGVASRELYQQLKNNQTPLKAFFTHASFALWLQKILELDHLRDDFRDYLLQTPHIQQLSLQLANHLLTENTPWLDYLRKLQLSQHSRIARGLSFLQDQQQNIELKLEQRLAKVLLNQLGELITLPNDELADFCELIWSSVQEKTIKQCCMHIEAIDFEEFFILAYESWKQLRQTALMQTLILRIVDVFYQHFAEDDLQSLILAVGLNKTDLYTEAERFLPPILKVLDQIGLLEQMLKNLLEPFYNSAQTQRLIDAHIQQMLDQAK